MAEDDIVVIAPDRQDGCEYNQPMAKNCVPTFTTQNHDMMLLSVGDVVRRVPDAEFKFSAS